MNFIDKILKEAYSGAIVEHKREQTFQFFTKLFDIDEAERLITENPAKYKKPDGQFYSFQLDVLNKWMSVTTPEEKAQQDADLKAGKSISLKMGVRVGYEYAVNIPDSNLEEPGIWLAGGEGFSMLIDGWHRAYGRIHKGYTDMEIWVISDPKDIEKITIR